MSALKNIFAGCAVILICAALTGCSVTPKTVDQFINNYNREIRNAMEWHVSKNLVNNCAAKCSIGQTNVIVRRKNCVFREEMVTFNGNESGGNFAGSLEINFRFHESIPASEIFAMIDAAIIAVGDDYKSVESMFGILKDGHYNIRGGYQKRIKYGSKEYELTWLGEYIVLDIKIPK